MPDRRVFMTYCMMILECTVSAVPLPVLCLCVYLLYCCFSMNSVRIKDSHQSVCYHCAGFAECCAAVVMSSSFYSPM